MIVRRSALVERPATHMFDLIEAAEDYPHFLPWCAGATIVHRDEAVVSADLRVQWGGMHFEMRTTNPKRRPEHMLVHLERGPFSRFEGQWTLKPLGSDACKVEFVLDYEFDSAVMTRVAGPVFNRMADSMVDAFVQHAMRTPPPEPAPATAAAGVAAVDPAPATAGPEVAHAAPPAANV